MWDAAETEAFILFNIVFYEFPWYHFPKDIKKMQGEL